MIDDDPLVLEATEGLLRSWGCCVVAAESCDEALVCLTETEAGPTTWRSSISSYRNRGKRFKFD
jgi:CheY-like chemotaxis protein